MAFWASNVISPSSSKDDLNAIAAAATRFGDIAAAAGADVLITNHERYFDLNKKLYSAHANPAGRNPFIVGKTEVRNYMQVSNTARRRWRWQSEQENRTSLVNSVFGGRRSRVFHIRVSSSGLERILPHQLDDAGNRIIRPATGYAIEPTAHISRRPQAPDAVAGPGVRRVARMVQEPSLQAAGPPARCLATLDLNPCVVKVTALLPDRAVCFWKWITRRLLRSQSTAPSTIGAAHLPVIISVKRRESYSRG